MSINKIVLITLFFSCSLGAMAQVPVIALEPTQQVLATVSDPRVLAKQERWATVLDQRAWRRKASWAVLGTLGAGVTYYLVRSWFAEPSRAPKPSVDGELVAHDALGELKCRLLEEKLDEIDQQKTLSGFIRWCAKDGLARGINIGIGSFLVAIFTRAISSSQTLFSSTMDRISGFNEDALFVEAMRATMRNSLYLSQSWGAVLKAADTMDPACEALYRELLYRIAIDAYAFVDSFESCCAFINAALVRRGLDDAGITLQKSMARAMRLVNDGMSRQQAAYLLAAQQLTLVSSGGQPADLQASSLMVVNQSVQGELLRFFQEAGSVLYDIDCMSLLAGTEHGTK